MVSAVEACAEPAQQGRWLIGARPQGGQVEGDGDAQCRTAGEGRVEQGEPLLRGERSDTRTAPAGKVGFTE
ncbi:hypothetical protein ACWEWX_40800 [Streptomyces asiaticus]